MSDETIKLGVVGSGGFGFFAPQRFAQAPGVRLVGMAGARRGGGRRAKAGGKP